MNESDEDRLLEEWHELARTVEVGAPVELVAATELLNEVLRTFAPTLPRPHDQAETLFFVASTRKLEKIWNTRLGKILIDAGNARDSNDLAIALAVLDEFTERCPWVLFSRIAQDQRANYAASC